MLSKLILVMSMAMSAHAFAGECKDYMSITKTPIESSIAGELIPKQSLHLLVLLMEEFNVKGWSEFMHEKTDLTKFINKEISRVEKSLVQDRNNLARLYIAMLERLKSERELQDEYFAFRDQAFSPKASRKEKAEYNRLFAIIHPIRYVTNQRSRLSFDGGDYFSAAWAGFGLLYTIAGNSLFDWPMDGALIAGMAGSLFSTTSAAIGYMNVSERLEELSKKVWPSPSDVVKDGRFVSNPSTSKNSLKTLTREHTAPEYAGYAIRSIEEFRSKIFGSLANLLYGDSYTTKMLRDKIREAITSGDVSDSLLAELREHIPTLGAYLSEASATRTSLTEIREQVEAEIKSVVLDKHFADRDKTIASIVQTYEISLQGMLEITDGLIAQLSEEALTGEDLAATLHKPLYDLVSAVEKARNQDQKLARVLLDRLERLLSFVGRNNDQYVPSSGYSSSYSYDRGYQGVDHRSFLDKFMGHPIMPRRDMRTGWEKFRGDPIRWQ